MKNLLAVTTSLFILSVSYSASAGSYDEIPNVLLDRIAASNLTVDNYVTEKKSQLERNGGQNGNLTKQMVEAKVKQWQEKRAKSKTRIILLADADADGKVTKDEAKNWISNNKMRPAISARKGSEFITNWFSQNGLDMTDAKSIYTPFDENKSLKAFMLADINKDNVITPEEMQAEESPNKDSSVWGIVKIFELNPDGDDVLKAEEYDQILRKAFSHVDIDGNGVISEEELASYTIWHREKAKILYEQDLATSANAENTY